MDRVMRKLEMRREAALVEHGAADAGSQGQHDFKAQSLNNAKPLHLRIVEQPGRLAEPLRHGVFQREAAPRLRLEMRRRDHASIPDDPGKADRNTIEWRKRRGQLSEFLDQYVRRARIGRLHPHTLAKHFAENIEDRGFQTRAANVDSQRSHIGAKLCRSFPHLTGAGFFNSAAAILL